LVDEECSAARRTPITWHGEHVHRAELLHLVSIGRPMGSAWLCNRPPHSIAPSTLQFETSNRPLSDHPLYNLHERNRGRCSYLLRQKIHTATQEWIALRYKLQPQLPDRRTNGVTNT
jgi:hypothetical protein